MEIITTRKIEKFVTAMEDLVSKLDMHQNLTIHHEISDSYYMEKIAELRVLQTQLFESLHGVYLLQGRIHSYYKSAYCCWKRDARWLSHYLRESPS